MSLSPRILYVDDDADNCAFMSYWLKKDFGYDVVLAMDGRQAKEFIAQEFFDLYLLDYCLPDVTATVLCRDIKSVNPTAPIIVYSALDRDVDRRLAISAGADRYFIKPDQIDLVGDEITRYFGVRKDRTVWGVTDPSAGSSISTAEGHNHNRKRASRIL